MKRIYILEILFVTFIVSICLFLLSFGFFQDIILTPLGSVYLGTIHYAPDYFNYMTWIVQGEHNVLFSTLLYSVEQVPSNLSRWEFVLLGFVFSRIGFDPIWTYHIGVFLFRIFFFISSYFVIRLFFPRSIFKRLLAFFFFATCTTFPLIEFTDVGVLFGYRYFWYNTGNFFARFGPTPNHLLGSALLCMVFYFFIRLFQDFQVMTLKKRHIYLIFLFVFGFLLSSISPIHWALVSFSAVISAVIFPIIQKIQKRQSIQHISLFNGGLASSGLLLISGIIPALYLHTIYSQSPYTLVTAWEAVQRLEMDMMSFFLASGIVVLFAGVGILSSFREVRREWIFAFVFLAVCFILFVSQIHLRLGIMNVRFWPQSVYVFIGVFAVIGIYSFSSLFRGIKEFVIVSLILVYIFTTASSYIGQIQAEIKPRVGDATVYLSREIYEIYMVAKKVPTTGVFLVQWPLNQSFPALTGKKVLYGDPISNMTLNAHEKAMFTIGFLDATLSVGEVKSAMRQYGITHVIAYKGMKYEKYDFLKKLHETANVSLYEVLP